jgi:hypothetical protein
MELYYENLSLDDIIYIDDNGFQKTEEWRDVPDWERFYMASNLGRIKSLSRERWNGKVNLKSKEIILKQHKGKKGYLGVVFTKNNIRKSIRVNKLLAIAFLGHKPDGTLSIVVDHKNNIKHDNRLLNLQLLSNRENCSKDRINKSSIFRGVYKINDKKFKSSIYFNGTSIRLGTFKTEEEASEYYKNALKAIENGGIINRNIIRSPSKFKLIYFDKIRNKWLAYIKLKGEKRKYLRCFNSEEEAFEFQQNYIKNLNNK